MRPVNLIPLEERHGEKAPLRVGPFSYVIVAMLALALAGVTAVVLTNNQISDREAQKTSLQSQVKQAQADAKSLDSFVAFASLQQARQQTVTSLATSRFDWERVLRELAIVIPGDVWLTNLDAQASGGASASGTSSSSSTAAITGPSLDIQGCSTGHDAVARFLASLRDIDGVTRATVMNDERQTESSTGGSTGSTNGTSCASRNFIVSFEVVIAFDDAQPATSASATPTTDAATADTTAVSGSTATSADGSQVADGQQQLQQQKDSAAHQTSQARKDTSTFIPGTGTSP